MGKNIVLFSHNTHTFIINEIKYASKFFDKVLLLSPSNKELEVACSLLDNVEHITLRKTSIKAAIVSLISPNKKLPIRDFITVLRKGKISTGFLKIAGLYLDCERQLLDLLIKRNIGSGENWTLLSLWFGATSYAVCRAKQQYPSIKAISLAHSFEVDPLKNQYVECFYKDFCHKKLDCIDFISHTVMEQYVKNYAIPHGWETSHITVDYLGVEKKYPGLANYHTAEPFHLVSCSHCVPVKRIDLIASALATLHDIKIHWTHIGSGQEYEKLRHLTSKFGDNIKVCFPGAIPNDLVHKFMAENAIDAFINVSSSEGLPVTLMEAISYGIPVIATDVGGNCEVVSDQVGRLLNANPTVEEIAQAISDILTSEKKVKEQYKKNAVMLYETKFMAENIRPLFYQKVAEYC